MAKVIINNLNSLIKLLNENYIQNLIYCFVSIKYVINYMMIKFKIERIYSKIIDQINC